MTPPAAVPVVVEALTDEERDAVLAAKSMTPLTLLMVVGTIKAEALAAVLAPVVAGAVERAVEEALTDAADAVRDCRENGMPPGFLSHPYHEGFEKWLRNRATRVVREGGQPS